MRVRAMSRLRTIPVRLRLISPRESDFLHIEDTTRIYGNPLPVIPMDDHPAAVL